MAKRPFTFSVEELSLRSSIANEQLNNIKTQAATLDISIEEEIYKLETLVRQQDLIYNNIKSSRYLNVSNEGLGTFLEKLWEAIKSFFRGIAELLGLSGKKQEVIISRTSDACATTLDRIKKLPPMLQNASIKDVYERASRDVYGIELRGANKLMSINNLPYYAFLRNELPVVYELLDETMFSRAINQIDRIATDLLFSLKTDKTTEAEFRKLRYDVQSLDIYPKTLSLFSKYKRDFISRDNNESLMFDTEKYDAVIGVEDDGIFLWRLTDKEMKENEEYDAWDTDVDYVRASLKFNSARGNSSELRQEVISIGLRCYNKISDLENILQLLIKLRSKTSEIERNVNRTVKFANEVHKLSIPNINASNSETERALRKKYVLLLKLLKCLGKSMGSMASKYAKRIEGISYGFEGLVAAVSDVRDVHVKK